MASDLIEELRPTNGSSGGNGSGGSGPNGANPIDAHVGRRIKQRRTALGLSQEKLGEALGLTFQQVQKYERGINRVGASRLYDISRVLGVQVCYFYEEIGGDHAGGSGGVGPLEQRRAGAGGGAGDPFAGPMAGGIGSDPETTELVRAFNLIADQGTRKDVLNIVRRFGQAEA